MTRTSNIIDPVSAGEAHGRDLARGPLIAVSLGDPAGIGPELICEAWRVFSRRIARRQAGPAPRFAVIGGAQILREAASLRGIDCPVIEAADPAQARRLFARGLPVLSGADGAYTPGMPDAAGAAIALESLRRATRLALSGEADGLVTAPISKHQLAQVGFDHPGQTEFLAHACGLPERSAVMMLAGPSLRTVPLTVHVPLASVASLLDEETICAKARIVADQLARDFGIEAPRLALAALNPHAGEGGRFGDEEARILAPAVRRLQGEGLHITGPHPADALFTPRARETFDVALCPYHDQALIPIKALDFDEGVNITLGLPFLRTSPDHGTAFDIAGRKLAHPGAMIAAIEMAGRVHREQARG